MRVIKSFVDPLTMRAYRRGSEYNGADKEHVRKLVSAGILFTPPVSDSKENEQRNEEVKPRRKRGGKDGNSG